MRPALTLTSALALLALAACGGEDQRAETTSGTSTSAVPRSATNAPGKPASGEVAGMPSVASPGNVSPPAANSPGSNTHASGSTAPDAAGSRSANSALNGSPVVGTAPSASPPATASSGASSASVQQPNTTAAAAPLAGATTDASEPNAPRANAGGGAQTGVATNPQTAGAPGMSPNAPFSGSVDQGRAPNPAPPARSANDTTADTFPTARSSADPATTGATPPAGPGQAPGSAGARPEAVPNASSTARAPDPTRALPPGRYQADRISLDLQDGGAFELATTGDGRKVTGRYEVKDGMLVLSDGQGDIEGATFPIRCRIDRSGTVIRLLNADDGACRQLHGLQLRGQA